MPLSTNDFRLLADLFTGLADSIVEFEKSNQNNLNDTDFQAIDGLRVAALHYSDHFLLVAVQQTLKDITAPLAEICTATKKMNQVLRTLNNINKWFVFATAGIQLGAALITAQVPAITTALEKVIQLGDPSFGSALGSSQQPQTSSQ